jgi:hypothetical protein
MQMEMEMGCMEYVRGILKLTNFQMMKWKTNR